MAFREPKPQWVEAIRRAWGDDRAFIRWNHTLGRWEFGVPAADGVVRSQFFGHFYTQDGKVMPKDHLGLPPFRELDDDGVREVIRNAEKTFVGNPHDGMGSPKKEMLRRMRRNDEKAKRFYQEKGELFADMCIDRGHRLRGAKLFGWHGRPVR